MPQLTIITINRNNANGLKRTLTSVLSQSVTDFEYIVIDGASSDGSLEILKTQNTKHRTQNFKFISEPDSGIYNAMNKAIAMATGDYLLFINSGDELADSNVVKSFEAYVNEDSELCSGDLLLINNNEQKKLKAPKEISLSYCLQGGLTHPNTFIRKSLFEKYGYYNEANKIVSDWEFFLIAAGLNNCKYQQLNFTVARFYEDGISSVNKELVSQEMQKSISRLVPSALVRDINRLLYLETKLSNPAHKIVQQSISIRKLFEILHKVQRKLRKAFKSG